MGKCDPRKTTILHQIQTILERQLNSQRLRESSTIKRPRSPRHLTSLAVGDCWRGRLISNAARLKRQSLTEPLKSRLRSVPVLQLIENKLALLVDGFSVHGAFNPLDASEVVSKTTRLTIEITAPHQCILRCFAIFVANPPDHKRHVARSKNGNPIAHSRCNGSKSHAPLLGDEESPIEA